MITDLTVKKVFICGIPYYELGIEFEDGRSWLATSRINYVGITIAEAAYILDTFSKAVKRGGAQVAEPQGAPA